MAKMIQNQANPLKKSTFFRAQPQKGPLFDPLWRLFTLFGGYARKKNGKINFFPLFPSKKFSPKPRIFTKQSPCRPERRSRAEGSGVRAGTFLRKKSKLVPPQARLFSTKKVEFFNFFQKKVEASFVKRSAPRGFLVIFGHCFA